MRKNKALRCAMGVLALLTVVALLVSGCSSPAPAPTAPAGSTPAAAAPSSGAEPIEIKAITFLQPTDERAVLFQDLLKLIEQKSNGRITVKFLGGPEVMPPPQFADNLKAGNINLAQTPAAFMEGLVPGLSVIQASQLSAEEERKVGLWDKLNEMCAPGGLRFIGRFMPHNDPAVYLGVRNKEITKLDDLKGLKMGYPSATLKDFAESVGMASVTIMLGDAYTAIEKGTIDIHAAPINDVLNYKLYEVEKYVIDHPFLVTQGTFIMNLAMWEKLGPDLQKVVTDAYLEWEPTSIATQRATEQKIKNELMNKPNLKFVKLPGDEGAKLGQMAFDAEWVKFPEDKPELAKELKALMTKK